MNRLKLGAMSTVLVVAAAANAQVNHFFWSNGTIAGTSGKNTDSLNTKDFNESAGKVNFISAEDNNTKGTFSFDANFSRNSQGKTPNAFWLVVSNGPNPKGTPGELVAFYFDASKSKPVVSAYGYNGVNGDNSYKDGSPAAGIQTPDRIVSSITNTSWLNRVSFGTDAAGNRTLGFDVDQAILNNYKPKNGNPADWDGVNFSSKFGLWFHPVTDASTSYDAQGFLTNFTFDKQGWVDFSDKKTKSGPSPVPEPASMAVIGLGIAGLVRRKRK